MSVSPIDLPVIGKTTNAIVFIRKIIKIAKDIWLGIAFIIDDIARAAVAPQIAVADEIKYTNFVSKLKNLPINKPKMNVSTTKMLMTGK